MSQHDAASCDLHAYHLDPERVPSGGEEAAAWFAACVDASLFVHRLDEIYAPEAEEERA